MCIDDDPATRDPQPAPRTMGRREFASVAAAAAAGFLLTACGPRRLHEIPRDRLRKAIADWERDYTQQYGKPVTVSDRGPIAGVLFAYALDLSRCNGSRRCAWKCRRRHFPTACFRAPTATTKKICPRTRRAGSSWMPMTTSF